MKKISFVTFPEAEVVLRLLEANILSNKIDNTEVISINIDSEQVKSNNNVIFDVTKFLHDANWIKSLDYEGWRGVYKKKYQNDWYRVELRSKSGIGDFSCKLLNEPHKYLYVECKKGALPQRGNSEEYKLLREAIGQIATLESYDEKMYKYSICVPENEVYSRLMNKWKGTEGIKRLGIKFLMITKNNVLIEVN